MSFLGLVGAPVVPMSYGAYRALTGAGTALAAVLQAAEAAAVAGIIGSTAAVLGAGATGWMIGDAIMKSLERPETLPSLDSYYEAGNSGDTVALIYSFYVNGNPVYVSVQSQALDAPVRGSFFRRSSTTSQFYVIDRYNLVQPIVGTNGTWENPRFVIENFVKLPGSSPIAPTKKLPSTLPKNPNLPAPVPATVPLPGYPNFPITPYIPINPDNDPDEPDKEVAPGVIVRIPELGIQLRYTPNSVSIGRYNSPETKPFEVPEPELQPPGNKVAAPPCPCEQPDNTELLCRVKALEDGLLDGGYNESAVGFSNADSGTYDFSYNNVYAARLLVNPPTVNGRSQWGGANGVEINYCGWFAWRMGEYQLERIPLQYLKQEFLAPEGVTGFTYTCTHGAVATPTLIRRSKKPYVDAC